MYGKSYEFNMGDNKECFFISPIGSEGSEVRERSNKVLEYIVEEAVSDYGFSVTRADRMDQPGSITNQVIQNTINSELVVADLTGHNPNVFYELAVRHATGEPYIQLIKSSESIPFDISDFRTIEYGLEVDKADQAKEKICGILEKLEDEDTEFDNPISASAEMKSLRESSDPTDQNLAEILNTMYSLNHRMDQLENLIAGSKSESVGENVKISDFSQDSSIDPLKEHKSVIYHSIMQFEKINNNAVPRSQLVSDARDLGIGEEALDEILDELMMDGKIYSPVEGSFKSI